MGNCLFWPINFLKSLALYVIYSVPYRYVDAGTLMNNYAHIFDLLTRLRQVVQL